MKHLTKYSLFESTRYYISWKKYITREQLIQVIMAHDLEPHRAVDYLNEIEEYLSDYDLDDDCDIDYNYNGPGFKYGKYFGVVISPNNELGQDASIRLSLDTERLHQYFPNAKMTRLGRNKISIKFFID